MLLEAHPTNSASLQLSTWQGRKHDMLLAGAPLPAPLFPLGFTSHVQLQGPSTEWERAASAPLLPSIQTPLSCNEVNEVESFAALGRWWWEMEVTNRCFSPFPCSPSRVDGSGRCRLSCARLLGGGGEFGDGSSRWVTLLFAESKNGSLLLFLSTAKKKKSEKGYCSCWIGCVQGYPAEILIIQAIMKLIPLWQICRAALPCAGNAVDN